MNQILTAILGQLGEKGADKKRNASLLVLIFIAWQVTNIDKRLTHVEARLGVTRQAVTTPRHVTPAASPTGTNFAHISKDWPEKADSPVSR